MKRPLGLALLLLHLHNCGAVERPLELANASVPEARRIPYGSDPRQFGELRVPSTKDPHPLAIVVHGGCWLATLGNMDERVLGLDHLRPLAAALTEAGIARGTSNTGGSGTRAVAGRAPFRTSRAAPISSGRSRKPTIWTWDAPLRLAIPPAVTW
jgi:hypothetical protein